VVSPAWTARDKVIGTLVIPGGLLPAGALVFFPTYSVGCYEVTNRRGRVIEQACTDGGPTNLEQIALWLLFALLLIGPIASAIYLGYRLRRRPAAAP
jgi:hypothetical protein